MTRTYENYDFSQIEAKWQNYWITNKTFKTSDFSDKPKYYAMDMFPYPSGSGLHVGHAVGYTASDVMSRYKRMRGYHVLHPMGWDAFGLPAEQYAIKTGTHPEVTTKENVDAFRKQIQKIGYSIDWDREVNTTDSHYYKWTQWIFLQLYKKGLAYQSFEAVNWCPELGTVLANEEVIDGRSEVGGHPVIKKPIRQWVLKITAYAEELLRDLDELDWPESTKEMQRHWIGKSEGAQVRFDVKDHPGQFFEIFTTCPHTLFGATFCVLAPEHPIVSAITTKAQQKLVADYAEEAKNKSDMDRSALGVEKTGVFTGAFAINPLSKEPVPIYVADYVLMHYGTGAIMAVPAHDDRDHAFAKRYGIPMKVVVEPSQTDHDFSEKAFTQNGVMVSSSFLDGLQTSEAITKVCSYLEEKNLGTKKITYRLRDWVFSRQRYWGEPFPLVHLEDGTVVPVSENELPVTLPAMDAYQPRGDGEPPLSRAEDWLHQDRGGRKGTRETNIMPQWAGSCWYYFRYLDPFNETSFCDKKKSDYWLPVDLYIGGAEHANLHLLYARFWHKVLYDLGLVHCKEPFKKVVHQGLILGSSGEKMSKSRGNVVNPDDVIAEWGADSLRMFEMFMGPFDQMKPWMTSGITGIHRFLKRVWRLFVTEQGEAASLQYESCRDEQKSILHKTIKKVTEDTEHLRFNTAISAMMEWVNHIYKDKDLLSKEETLCFIKLLSPYAPHLAQELWSVIDQKEELAFAPWPTFDPALTEDDNVTIAVMVNGKHRGNLTVAKSLEKDAVIALAKKEPTVAKYLDHQIIKKEVFVPMKIVSFVF